MRAQTAKAFDPSVSRARLDRLQALVREELGRVNQVVVAEMQSPVDLIPQLAQHLVAAGGKRIRPILTLTAARLCGYAGDRHVNLAACVEFIHTATLMHDDVVDASDLRRGRATANAVWGNKAPVLVGDFLFSRAFQLMVRDGSLDVLRILSHASAVIAEGEVLQLMTAHDSSTTEAAYFEMITAKTAKLFEAAAEIGAVVAGRPPADAAALAEYGRSIGIAFQLIDDALDYGAEQQDLGKTVGDDFADGKVTLPVVLAVAAADDGERAFWKRVLETGERQDGDFVEAMRLLVRHDAIAATVRRAEIYGERARRALDELPRCAERDALLDLVDFCIERAY
ncbi:MAG: polyprenyl synthetase family protein [Pseudomonadota bacterium]